MTDEQTAASSSGHELTPAGIAAQEAVKEQPDVSASDDGTSRIPSDSTTASLSSSPSKTQSTLQPSSSSTPEPHTTSAAANMSTSTSTPISQPIPTKPRSDSILHSTRPAPPSPAPSSSRPNSQTLSPTLHPTPPSGSGAFSRDRASSTSSSRGGGVGRRVSNSSHPSRTSSRPRPRSALGASSFLPNEDQEGTQSSSTVTTADSSLAATPIPENSAAPDPTTSPRIASSPTSLTSPTGSPPKRKNQEVIIKDFAFESTDPRFLGPGLPLSAPDQPNSRRSSSKWGWGSSGDSPDPNNGAGGSSSRKGSGWGGFGLLSWRGFMGKTRRTSTEGEDEDEDEENDYPIPVPDHDEDDYPFSESETGSELNEDDSEPWGFYRAAYAFDALGEHEIGLQDGDVVEVRGRGGGDGWVVAVKRELDAQGRVVRLEDVGQGEGKEGLVPESYLEKAGDLLMAERATSVEEGKGEEPETSNVADSAKVQ